MLDYRIAEEFGEFFCYRVSTYVFFTEFHQILLMKINFSRGLCLFYCKVVSFLIFVLVPNFNVNDNFPLKKYIYIAKWNF